MDRIGPNMDHKGLKILFFVPKIPFCGNFVCRTYAFGGNIPEWEWEAHNANLRFHG